jgi:formylglycine-generating enzyme required for sulfatase activity
MLRAIEIHVPFGAKAAAAGTSSVRAIPLTLTREDNLVTIAGGTFWMGAQKTDQSGRSYDPEAGDDEGPPHQVTLRGFRMARFPLTVKEFARFVDSGGYREEKNWVAGGFGAASEPANWAEQQKNPEWPVVGVSWFEASAYCVWAGLRLPTEAEWERVARGPRSARYPWSDELPLDELRANYKAKIGHPTPEGQYPNGRSVEGVEDLLGNVWEWCGDWYGGYSKDGNENPAGPRSGYRKVLRGGAWSDFPGYVRVSYRIRDVPTSRKNDFGFRCAGELR